MRRVHPNHIFYKLVIICIFTIGDFLRTLLSGRKVHTPQNKAKDRDGFIQKTPLLLLPMRLIEGLSNNRVEINSRVQGQNARLDKSQEFH